MHRWRSVERPGFVSPDRRAGFSPGALAARGGTGAPLMAAVSRNPVRQEYLPRAMVRGFAPAFRGRRAARQSLLLDDLARQRLDDLAREGLDNLTGKWSDDLAGQR